MQIIRPKSRPPSIPVNITIRDLLESLEDLPSTPNFYSEQFPESSCRARLERAARVLFRRNTRSHAFSEVLQAEIPDCSSEFSIENSTLAQPSTIPISLSGSISSQATNLRSATHHLDSEDTLFDVEHSMSRETRSRECSGVERSQLAFPRGIDSRSLTPCIQPSSMPLSSSLAAVCPRALSHRRGGATSQDDLDDLDIDDLDERPLKRPTTVSSQPGRLARTDPAALTTQGTPGRPAATLSPLERTSILEGPGWGDGRYSTTPGSPPRSARLCAHSCVPA